MSKLYIGQNNIAVPVRVGYYGVNNKAVKVYESSSPTPPAPTIVSWADGTDEEIAAMLEAHYNGELDIHDYWNIGDTRTVSLSAMGATNVGESHSAQNIDLVLVESDNDNYKILQTNTTAAFIVQQKSILDNKGYMCPSNSVIISWENSPRRQWCNSTYYNALPKYIQSIIKCVTVKTADNYQDDSITITNDLVFLPTCWEITNLDYYTFKQDRYYMTVNRYESRQLSTWGYYASNYNRQKGYNWWTRSLGETDYGTLGRCRYASIVTSMTSTLWPFSCESCIATEGIAPCFCI